MPIYKQEIFYECCNIHQHNNTGTYYFALFIFIVDRDIQCDFDSPFYEENECGWKYSQKTMTSLGFGSTKRLTRDKFDNANLVPMNYFETQNTIFGECSRH